MTPAGRSQVRLGQRLPEFSLPVYGGGQATIDSLLGQSSLLTFLRHLG